MAQWLETDSKLLKKQRQQLNPRVSADCVIFGFDMSELNVLLIERKSSNKNGTGSGMALPGDLIYESENLDMAANRVLKELTGLKDIFLKQVGAFGDPNRLNKESDREWLKSVRDDPDARVITVAYYSLVKMTDYAPQASSFAQTASWVPVRTIEELAFDHYEILTSALNRLKENLNVQPIGFNLLPEKFTLSQLHRLYEAILGKELDKRNFRRKILNLKILSDLSEKQKGVPHKPSQFYAFNQEKYDELAHNGFNNFGF